MTPFCQLAKIPFAGTIRLTVSLIYQHISLSNTVDRCDFNRYAPAVQKLPLKRRHLWCMKTTIKATPTGSVVGVATSFKSLIGVDLVM